MIRRITALLVWGFVILLAQAPLTGVHAAGLGDFYKGKTIRFVVGFSPQLTCSRRGLF